MSVDVLMDPITGDLAEFSQFASGVVITAQRVETRLSTHRGDWPLNKNDGIDWIGLLGDPDVTIEDIAAEVAIEISGTPGVTEVRDLESEQTGRLGTISATVSTDDGDFAIIITPAGAPGGNPSIVVGGIIGHSGGIANP